MSYDALPDAEECLNKVLQTVDHPTEGNAIALLIILGYLMQAYLNGREEKTVH